jgi:hypothetical protein
LLPPKRIFLSLKRIVKEFAPIVEKLSVNFWFMALMAVIIPTTAIMPKAMMATVSPVRSLLLRMERNASEKMSRKFMLITKIVTGYWTKGDFETIRKSNNQCHIRNNTN